jgi:hypothetical protein
MIVMTQDPEAFAEPTSEPTADELRTEIELAQAVRAMCQPGSSEWQDVSRQLAALFEQMRSRTSAAVGSAFNATLLGVSQRELDVPIAVGDRLLAELQKRGLAVLPNAHSDVATDSDTDTVTED